MINAEDFTNLQKMNPLWNRLNLSNLIPIHMQSVTLSTGGGTEAVSIDGVEATDLCQVSLISDDTGTTITHLHAACTAGTVTITRTDDGSSNDDGVAIITVYRPVS